jgi:PAS domain S-box-containing protein
LLNIETAAGSRSPPAAEHFVRFYDQEPELLDEVADFLDDALRSGGFAVAIATTPHCRELQRRLAGFGGAVDGPTKWFSGQLLVLDAAQTLDAFMRNGKPDAALFEATIGPILQRGRPGKPLHAFGEMVALLCERGDYEAALALEQLWNGIASRYAFALYCGYPMRLFGSAERSQAFRHVCAAHARIAGEAKSVPSVADNALTTVQLRQQALALEAEVTRRKEAEQILRQRERELAEFLDHASEGIHKVAADGTILYANRAELDLLGYDWEEYVGHPIAQFYADPRQVEGILERLARGEVLRDEPALLRRKDGTTVPVLIHSNGCFEDGKLAYTRCFTRDATDRVERDKLLESLREASRAKDEFLAMLGHELRNPLSPIVTALQLMRMRGDMATEREQAIIRRQVDHMVRLVDDLLDISRITRGKFELKREQADIGVVLAKAVEQTSLLLEQRNHRLEMDIEPNLRCECDPVRLAQVVANLLTNAARYTRAGGDIRLMARRETPGELVIRVRDNGSGIPPEMMPRLFEPFYQAPRTMDRTEGGLGIGLALVRSIVELHGGKVEGFSEGRDRGSEFVVRLPWIVHGARAAQHTGASAGAAVSPGKRVLLVDDNRDAADTLGEFLRASGHEVTICHDAPEALELLADANPEVAILDIGLPVMDGYELAGRVRAVRGASCLLIALTGYGQEGDKARSEAAGFNVHLVKPVDPQDVLGLLA